MFCNCKNCDHCHKHEDGLFCDNKMIFVNPHDGCDDFNIEMEIKVWNNPMLYVAIFAIVVLILLNIFA